MNTEELLPTIEPENIDPEEYEVERIDGKRFHMGVVSI